MTGQSILIAAFSGRALAQSARRAGYVPLVVDAFGDMDTRATADLYAGLPSAIRRGFEAKSLFTALDGLVDCASSPPLGIVLGSGFEDRPKLIESLDARYGLLGSKAGIVRQLKDPAEFFSLLKQLRINHPETTLTRPDDPKGWLAKRIGGAGGAHIRDLENDSKTSDKHYFQRRIEGTPMSVFAVASKGGVALELSRQWTAPSQRKPYRYGGAVIVDYNETAAEQSMVTAAATLIELLDPVGLVSFDFLVNGGSAYLLEINPRPGATLDIFDDVGGNLFRAHVEAGLGNELWQQRDLPAVQSRASAILYADQGSLTAGEIEWPGWTADRPAPGMLIPAEQPIATVFAEGSSADEAERFALTRLSTLADLVYTASQKT